MQTAIDFTEKLKEDLILAKLDYANLNLAYNNLKSEQIKKSKEKCQKNK